MKLADNAALLTGPYVIIPGETGVVNPFWPVCDLRRYGGVPGGIIDAKTALANANTSALAIGAEIIVAGGTFLINSNITVSAPLNFAGGILKAGAAATVTIAGAIDLVLTKIFDVSLGGAFSVSTAHVNELYPQWWGAAFTGGDDSAFILDAINSADTSGGRGAIVRLGGPLISIGTTTIRLRDNVQMKGMGRRATIVSYAGSGTAIDCTGLVLSGFSDLRLGIGSSPTAIGWDESSNANATTDCEFYNIEIASTNVAGQIGCQRVKGAEIISRCIHFGISFLNIDQPVVGASAEGNFWYACTIDTFGSGNSGAIAINDLTHTELWDFRIAGVFAGTTNSIAFKNQGTFNNCRLLVDTGQTALSLPTAGGKNWVEIRRPDDLTALGTFAPSNSVVDQNESTFRRICAGGTALTAANFSLSAGFGSTATVTAVTGTDQRHAFQVNAAGAGIAANPTITVSFEDEPWITPPFVIAVRNGGNQLSVPLLAQIGGISTSQYTLLFDGTPAAGESYGITVFVLG